MATIVAQMDITVWYENGFGLFSSFHSLFQTVQGVNWTI